MFLGQADASPVQTFCAVHFGSLDLWHSGTLALSLLYFVFAAMNDACTRTAPVSLPLLGMRQVRTPGPAE